MSVSRSEVPFGAAGLPDAAATARPVLVAAPAPASWVTRTVGAVHAGRPGLVAPSVDLLALAAASLALPGGPGRAVFVGCAAVALHLSGRVYRDRDRVVARGVGWWPRPLVGPVAVAALLAALEVGAPAALAVGALSVVVLLAVRALAWQVVAARRRSGLDLTRALVVGRDDRAATLTRTLTRHADFGLEAVLVVDGPSDPDTLARLAREHACEHVFLLPDDGAGLHRLRRSLGVQAHVSLVPFGADAFLDGRTGRRVGGVAVLPLGRPLRGPAPAPGKRAVDVAVSAALLVLLSPVLLACLLAVRLDDGGPALYRQRRTGLGGRPFQIVKLRTMRAGAAGEQPALTAYNTSDGLLFKMEDDPRITRVGRLLRRSGLDELPQLLNVLRGEMSLVGPRPLPVEADAFGDRDAERHLVRPGMTGLWQVSGGATLRYREMVDLDLAYVHGWTPGLDLQVLLATVGVLLRASLGTDGRER